MLTAAPVLIVAGASAIANGRCAASTAPCVFSIPAPLVCVVQMHSCCCRSPAGTWQTVVVVELLVGNGAAVRCNSVMYCAGDNREFSECISAAAPATSGAEKLVPMLRFAT